jgi:hypothetical protein
LRIIGWSASKAKGESRAAGMTAKAQFIEDCLE